MDGNRKQSLASTKYDHKVSTVTQSSRKSVASTDRNWSRSRMRKHSFGFRNVQGIQPIDRVSQVNFEYKRPPLLFLPTYQLEPKERFHVPKVTQMCNEVVELHFKHHKYNAMESPGLALKMSYEINSRAKQFSFNRYRLLSIVTIGQKRAQCYNNAIAFLWDHERDNYVNVQHEEPTAFVQITVFAIYLD